MKLSKIEDIPFSSRWKSCHPQKTITYIFSKKDNFLVAKYTKQIFQHFAACCSLMLSPVHICEMGSPQLYPLLLPSDAVFTASPSPSLLLTHAPLQFVKTARLTLQALPVDPCSLYSAGQSFPHQSQGRNSKLR